MSDIEVPRLTRKQEKNLMEKKSSYGYGSKPEDWEIVVGDLDRDVQKIGVVVCRFDIVNMLGAITSNRWYGNVIYAAAEKESVSVDDIRDYYIREAMEAGHGNEDEIRQRISLDSVRGATEFMRLSGLLNKLRGGQYKLSNATLRYWDAFEESHDTWNKQRPPTPMLKQMVHQA